MRRFIHALTKAIPCKSCRAACLAMAGMVGSVEGAVLAADNFESYPAGANLNGGSGGAGWTGNWVTVGGHTTAQTFSISDPGGNVAGGSQAARLQPTTNLADTASFIERTFPDTTDTLYMGMLIRKEVMDSGDFINFQVSDGATGNVTAALGVGLRNAAGNPFFARVGSSGSGSTDNAVSSIADTDYLIVAKFSKDGSASFNRTDLFINPSGFSEPGSADATAISGVTGIDTLSLFTVRHFQPEAGDRVYIDALSFGTTFADALTVPEPQTGVLVALLMVLGAGRRRRH